MTFRNLQMYEQSCVSVFWCNQRSARFLIPVPDLREGLTNCTAITQDRSRGSTAWFCHTLPYMSLYASAIMSRCELQRCVRMSINTSFSQPGKETRHRFSISKLLIFTQAYDCSCFVQEY